MMWVQDGLYGPQHRRPKKIDPRGGEYVTGPNSLGHHRHLVAYHLTRWRFS